MFYVFQTALEMILTLRFGVIVQQVHKNQRVEDTCTGSSLKAGMLGYQRTKGPQFGITRDGKLVLAKTWTQIELIDTNPLLVFIWPEITLALILLVP